MPLNVASLFVGVSANTSQAESQLNGFQGTLRRTASALESSGAGITTAIGAPIAAVGGAVIKLGSDFETSMSLVRKTTGLTADETKALGKGILDLSSSTAGGARTAEDLAKIAEVGGQLGVPKDLLLDFTRVIAQFSGATGIAGDQAASLLDSLRFQTGVDPSQLENLSSAVVDLGNKTNATEQQILEMGVRLAGAFHVAGATAQEVLGVSTTLAELHIDPEAGGTAISKFFIDMVGAASGAGGALKDTSGKTREMQERLVDLSASLHSAQQAQTQFGRNTPASVVNANAAAIERYKREISDTQADLGKLNSAQVDAKGSASAMARVAGITTDEFRALVKADPTAAFVKIVQGIKRIGQTEGAGAQFAAIESLGVDDARQIRAMIGLSEGADRLTTNLDTSNQAFKDNTAAAEENRIQMEATGARWQILTNQIKQQIIEAWDSLRPAVISAMATFQTEILPKIEAARLAFAGLPEPVRNFGIALGVILVVLGPALVLLGLMATAVSAISLPILAVVAAVGLLAAAWITNFGDIQGKTAAVFAFIGDNWRTLLQIILPGVGTLALLFIDNFATISAVVGRFLSFWGTTYVLVLTIAERALRQVGELFGLLLIPIQAVGKWIGDHILGPLLELLKFIAKILPSGAVGGALGGLDINGALRSGELALQTLSGGIAAGGPGEANSVIVHINNPVVPDQTTGERFAAQVREQIINVMVNSERASSPPPEPGLPGRPF